MPQKKKPNLTCRHTPLNTQSPPPPSVQQKMLICSCEFVTTGKLKQPLLLNCFLVAPACILECYQGHQKVTAPNLGQCSSLNTFGKCAIWWMAHSCPLSQSLNPPPDFTDLAQPVWFSLLKADSPYRATGLFREKLGTGVSDSLPICCMQGQSHIYTGVARAAETSKEIVTFSFATYFLLWNQSQLQLNTRFPEADLWKRKTAALHSAPISHFFLHWTICIEDTTPCLRSAQRYCTKW